ncbi:unnamed protein product [Cylindrotheca closterium]|uniref:Kinesin light chain n=1 Tax=Cylindrotheca closterium TaxID=2856 RepID=A0AAD2G8F6_9STRA|nr:unnamed protein product [Cylindrotheca closterium]
MNDHSTNPSKTLHIVDNDMMCEIRDNYEFKVMLESLEAKWLTNVETNKTIFGFQSVVDGGQYKIQSINTSPVFSANNAHRVQGRESMQARQPVSGQSGNNGLIKSEQEGGDEQPEQPKQRKRKARAVPGSSVLGRGTRPMQARQPVSGQSGNNELIKSEQEGGDEQPEQPKQRKRKATAVPGSSVLGSGTRPPAKARKSEKANGTERDLLLPQTEKSNKQELTNEYKRLKETALEHHMKGRYAEAIISYKKALHLMENVLGSQHADVAEIVYNIGSAFSDQKLPKKALEQYKNAMKIQVVVLGDEKSHVIADTYAGMASAYSDLGNHAKAIEAYQKALKIFQSHDMAASVAHTFNNIGRVLQRQFKYKEAIKMHEKALEIQESELGERHEDFATTISHFGCIFHCQGKLEDALRMHNKELSIRLEKLGTFHSDVAETYNSLGNVLKDNGDLEKALKMHDIAFSIRMEKLGCDHPSTTESCNNMAVVWNDQGEHKKAIEEYGKVLARQLKALGDEDPLVADTYNNLGCAHNRQGKNEEAIVEFEMALKIQEKVLGDNHQDTAKTYFNLAGVYHDQHKNEKALEMFRKAHLIQLEVLGEAHQDVADTLNYMAFVFKDLERYSEAMVMHKQALDIQHENGRTSAVGETHEYMGRLLKAQSRDREASEKFHDALSVYQDVFEEGHVKIEDARRELSNM